MEPLMTTRDLAEYLQVNAGWLANLRSQGGGPDFIKVGSAVRYRQADVERWVEAQRVEGWEGLGNEVGATRLRERMGLKRA